MGKFNKKKISDRKLLEKISNIIMRDLGHKYVSRTFLDVSGQTHVSIYHLLPHIKVFELKIELTEENNKVITINNNDGETLEVIDIQ